MARSFLLTSRHNLPDIITSNTLPVLQKPLDIRHELLFYVIRYQLILVASTEISDELLIAVPTVSQDLSELKDAGLIQGGIESPEVKYFINTDNWNLPLNFLVSF